MKPSAAKMTAKHLTSAQLGIWLGQSINPESPMYNAAEYLEFKGQFNQALFTRAAMQVLQQAAAINTAFGLANELPVQTAASSTVVHGNTLIFKDFSDGSAPHNQLAEFINDDLKRPFELEIGQNYRHALLKLADEHYIWHLTIHHIASDGYSFSLLADAVLARYQALTSGCLADADGLRFGDYNQVLQ